MYNVVHSQPFRPPYSQKECCKQQPPVTLLNDNPGQQFPCWWITNVCRVQSSASIQENASPREKYLFIHQMFCLKKVLTFRKMWYETCSQVPLTCKHIPNDQTSKKITPPPPYQCYNHTKQQLFSSILHKRRLFDYKLPYNAQGIGNADPLLDPDAKCFYICEKHVVYGVWPANVLQNVSFTLAQK